MKNITICFVYFRSLTLEHLDAALYSVRQQDFSRVNSLVVVDNNTEDDPREILKVVDGFGFPVPVSFHSYKHDDLTKTHAWSTNVAVKEVQTSWVLFTRADYLLKFDMLAQCLWEVDRRPEDWQGFVTGTGCHLTIDIGMCEYLQWRQRGPLALLTSGQTYDYTRDTEQERH